ncbi:MAG: VCBS repeat-containing protein, partial [Candidatus Sumerlaeota bacterium]|nr:VCBS repeat-containing protein [Candidatus Sumerlaeota bacterium]
MKSMSFTPVGSLPLPVCRLRAIASATERGIGIILLLLVCATLTPAEIAGKMSLSNNGSVAQSVTPFQMPDHRLALAVAFAYSDSVGIFTQESPGAPFVISQMMETGMHPGLANDLPRHILAMDTNQDTITDLVVLSSGNPNVGTRGSVQVFEGRPDGTFIPHTAYLAEPNRPDVFFLPVALAVAHLNGDMRPGLVVGYDSYPGVGIMEGEEMGDFEFREIVDLNVGDAPPPPTGENTGAPAVLCPDLDGDGMADLVVGCGNFLFIARGTGNLHIMDFKKIALPADCTITSLAVADLGRSSSLDIVAGVSGGYVYIFSGLSPDGVNCGPPLRLNALGNMPSKGVSDVVIADWNRD